jgi:uncharacterized protein
MYPEYRLGNLQHDALASMVQSEQQQRFGAAKEETSPPGLPQLHHLFACHGKCPKNRFSTAPDGEPGLNYLCLSYLRSFGTSPLP